MLCLVTQGSIIPQVTANSSGTYYFSTSDGWHINNTIVCDSDTNCVLTCSENIDSDRIGACASSQITVIITKSFCNVFIICKQLAKQKQVLFLLIK